MTTLAGIQIPADVDAALAATLAQKIEGLDSTAAITRRALRFFFAHLHKAGENQTDVGQPHLLPTHYAHEVAKASQVKVRAYRRKATPEADPVEEAV